MLRVNLKKMENFMDLEEAFKLAQADTKFIRVRKNLLYTFGTTRLPYICLSASVKNDDTVTVREGEVMADKAKIAIPNELFSFEGFDESLGDKDGEEGVAILLARRISMPPSKYVNKASPETVEQGPLSAAIQRAVNRLDSDNDVRTAIISAPEQVWGLSILLYVGSQVARSAPSNVQEHFEHMRLRGGGE